MMLCLAVYTHTKSRHKAQRNQTERNEERNFFLVCVGLLSDFVYDRVYYVMCVHLYYNYYTKTYKRYFHNYTRSALRTHTTRLAQMFLICGHRRVCESSRTANTRHYNDVMSFAKNPGHTHARRRHIISLSRRAVGFFFGNTIFAVKNGCGMYK